MDYDQNLFKLWIETAKHLLESKTLDMWQLEILEEAHQRGTIILMSIKSNKGKP